MCKHRTKFLENLIESVVDSYIFPWIQMEEMIQYYTTTWLYYKIIFLQSAARSNFDIDTTNMSSLAIDTVTRVTSHEMNMKGESLSLLTIIGKWPINFSIETTDNIIPNRA